MIFYHLFNRMENVELCHSLININIKGIPLLYYVADCLDPVPIFLIISGYGLYMAWRDGGDKNRWGRLLKLYIHFWIILFVFVSLACFLKPTSYPGSWFKILLNFSSFDTTYNDELWFLFPYAIVAIIAPHFFSACRKIKWYWIIVGTLLLYIGSINIRTLMIDSHYYWQINRFLYIPIFLFNFSLGMLAARENWFKIISEKSSHFKHYWRNIIGILFIIFMLAFSYIVDYNFFCIFFVVMGFNYLSYSDIIKKWLIKLGNQSMNMWMIHSWFCYHLFHDFIYSLRYPFLIFISLTVISFYLSKIFNLICLQIETKFLTRQEIKQRPIL